MRRGANRGRRRACFAVLGEEARARTSYNGGTQQEVQGAGEGLRGGSRSEMSDRDVDADASGEQASQPVAHVAAAPHAAPQQGAAGASAATPTMLSPLATPVTPAGVGTATPDPAYVSPEKKMWKVASASRMILAACDDRMREFLQKLGTPPNRLEEQVSCAGNPQRPDDQFFTKLAEVYNDPNFEGALQWSDVYLSTASPFGLDGRREPSYLRTQ
jgi:hypothetical protein